MQYGLVALLWGGWCVLHSVLATRRVVDGLQRYAGTIYRKYYRLSYNGISVVSLVYIMLYTRQIANEPVWVWTGMALAVPVLFVGLAAVVFVAGLRRYDMRQFLGWAQMWGIDGRGIAVGGKVDTRGILRVVRHPWYLAVLLLLWARDLQMADLVVNAVLMLYLVVGTMLEERKLIADFGDEYRAYQQRVSMLVPWKWFKPWIGGKN